MLKILVKFRDLILDLLFPIECLNCKKEGKYLCDKCFRLIKFNEDKVQEKLKKNLVIPNLDKIFIAGDYEDPILRNLIIKYKYDFISPLGKILASFLIAFWNVNIIEKPDVPIVIAIPLSKKRLRWRGFNQAEIIAREFSKYFDYKMSLNLKREKHQAPQAGLNEADRLKNIKSAFVWRDEVAYAPNEKNLSGNMLTGRTIILIDDVTTTGATLNEAAGVLKSAGAKEVYALVLAKG